MELNNSRSLRRMLRRYSDIGTFSFYVVVLFLLTPYVLDILLNAWEFQEGTMHIIARYIWTIDSNGVVALVCLVMGIYVGAVPLLLADEKKRFQAIIFLVVFTYVIWHIYIGILFPEIIWSENFHWVLLGACVSFFVSGGRNLLNGRKEFPRARAIITLISMLLIWFALIYYNIDLYIAEKFSANNGLLNDLLVTLTFSVFFLGFMNFKPGTTNIFVLGPMASGKSLFMAGTYLHTLEDFKTDPSNVSDDLINLIEEMQVKDWPDRSRELADYRFTHRSGMFFVKETEFGTLDYPGPYLKDIGLYLDATMNKTAYPEDGMEKQEKILHIVKRVIEAKSLILLVDGARYPNFTDMGIKYYLKILGVLNRHNKRKDIYIVVTKCDIFRDEYKNETGFSVKSPMDPEFNKFIMNKFIENTSMKQLLKESSGAMIYPVFYDTVEQEDGGYKLVKGEDQSIYPPFGYQNLMLDIL